MFSLLINELGGIAEKFDRLEAVTGNLIGQCVAKLNEIQDREDEIWKSTLFTLSVLCFSRILRFDEVAAALELFLRLLDNCAIDCLGHVCDGINYITERHYQHCEAHYFMKDDAKILTKLMRLVQRKVYHECVIRIFGNLSAHTDSTYIDALISLGLLEEMVKIFESEDNRMKELACWVLSNFTAGTSQQVEAVIFHKELTEHLIALAYSCPPFVAKQLVWTLSNATCHGSSTTIAKLVEYGCIECACKLLPVPQVNQHTCLEGLTNILREGENLVNEETLFNPYALRFANCGGLELLEDVKEDNDLLTFFGEKYELFLARKRGLLTKSARF